MNVPFWVWILTIVGIVLVIVVDLLIIDRGESKEFTTRQAAIWSTFFVVLAAVFGAGVWIFAGGEYGAQFAAGYLTEKSLSVDNLFVFYVIIGRFAVPKAAQHKVLMVGVVIALVLRGIFIAVGAAAVSRFTWVFFIFGAFLIWTAWGLLRGGDEEFKENRVLLWARRRFPLTDDYEGSRLSVRTAGRRLFTPLFIVMIAIGTTDVLFALDSIPAIFGLTREPYLVFTANVFALLGLRQLFFLIGGLLDRLVYLSYGLAVVLGFIGVKLVLEALHNNNLGFVNGGQPVHLGPEIPITVSLAVIAGALAVAAVASLIKVRQDERSLPSPSRDGERGTHLSMVCQDPRHLRVGDQ